MHFVGPKLVPLKNAFTFTNITIVFSAEEKEKGREET
jgi:hypothetical protein